MLSKLNLNDPNGLTHFWLVVFSFANSFVNPVLYGIYSSEFRHDYRMLLRKILCRKGASVSPEMSYNDASNCVTVGVETKELAEKPREEDGRAKPG